MKWNWYKYNLTVLDTEEVLSLLNSNVTCELNNEPHAPLYEIIEPFLILNITIKFNINIYIGVKKKLTSQHPRTTVDIKSSLNTWNNKNSLPKKPVLYGKPAKLKQTPKSKQVISNE